MCKFKPLPCVLAKRARVFNMRAFFQYTQRPFEPIHGDVCNLHTGVSACQAAPHTDTHTTDTTHHTLRTNTTHNDTAQHTTTPKHKTHIPHSLSTHTHTHSQHTRTTISTHTHNTQHTTYTTHTPPPQHTHITHTSHTHHTYTTHTNAWTRARRFTDHDHALDKNLQHL